jgi:hypothetical protein
MKKLISYGLVSGLNFAFLSYIILSNIKRIHKAFIYLTMINFCLVTIYFAFMTIYEFRIKLFGYSTVQSSKVYHFIKNRFFKFIFVLTISVCVYYWFLYLGGDDFMKQREDSSVEKWLIIIYTHGAITLFVILDFFFTRRQYEEIYFYKDLLIYVILNILYSISIIILSKTTDIVIYNYLYLEYRMIMFLNISVGIISVNIYLFYNYIMTKDIRRISFMNFSRFSESID